MNNGCPSVVQLQAYVQGELDGESTCRIEAHVAECEACRESLIDIRQNVDEEERVRSVHVYLRPQEVGPYRILGDKPIGRGGFGEVWLAARTEPYREHVAIKILQHAQCTEDGIQRFRREIKLLTLMKPHPNIVRVLAGGFMEDGRPYYVMEYVEGGRTIDAYCDQGQLNVHRRLELFRKVCSAVHHAHQAMILHRDVKPSNILVDTSGEPKLIDFGIATLSDRSRAVQISGFTNPTQVHPVSLAYASPEQLKSSEQDTLTTASDVYSLGVVLYELLSGYHYLADVPRAEIPYRILSPDTKTPPPSKAAMGLLITRQADGENKALSPEAAAKARGEQPRTLCRRLTGDLDILILHAMHKEPQRRYRSAEQFGEDIENYFHGLPLLARREKDSFWYRARKFISRNKLGVAAAALIALALTGGVVGASWGMLASKRAGHRAKAAEHVAIEQRKLAEDRRVVAEMNSTEAKRALYSLQKEKFRQAHEARRYGEAALWLSEASGLAAATGNDSHADLMCLQYEIGLASSFDWLLPAPVWIKQMYQPGHAHDPIWLLTGDTTLLSGKHENGTWSFSRALADLGPCANLKYSPASGYMLAACDYKLYSIQHQTGQASLFYPQQPEDGPVEEAFCCSRDGQSAFVVAKGMILRVAFDGSQVLQRWHWANPQQARAWDMAVDETLGQAVIQATIAGQKRLVVFDFTRSEEVLNLSREPGNGVGLQEGRAVFVGGEDSSELICIDLGPKPRFWRKKAPWTNPRLSSLTKDAITVLYGSGLLVEWSPEGEVRRRRRAVQGLNADAMFHLPSGTWLGAESDVLFQEASPEPVLASSCGVSAIESIRLLGDNRYVASTRGGRIEVRQCVDNKPQFSLNLIADDAAISKDESLVYALSGSRLVVHSRMTLAELAVLDGVKSPGFEVLAPQQGVVVCTSEGIHRYTADSLKRREQLSPVLPDSWAFDEDGVWLVSKNAELGRLEASRYNWKSATLDGPVLMECDLDKLTAMMLDPASRTLLHAYADGRVEKSELPTLDGREKIVAGSSQVLPPADSPVAEIRATSQGTLLLALRNGTLEQAYKEQNGSYAVRERSLPFAESTIRRVTLVDPHRALLLSNRGQLGLLNLSGSRATGAVSLPPCKVAGHLAVARPEMFFLPFGSELHLSGQQLANQELTGPQMGGDDWQQALMNQRKDRLAARDKGGAICVWALKEGLAQNPAMVHPLPSCSCFGFVGNDEIGVMSGDQFCLLDIHAPADPRIHVIFPLPISEVGGSFDLFATDGTELALASRSQSKIVFTSMKGQLLRTVRLMDNPSFLRFDMHNSLFMIGGTDAVYVLATDRSRVEYVARACASTHPGSSRAHTACLLPDRRTIAFDSDSKCICLAQLGAQAAFLEIPVEDDVWNLEWDDASSRLLWQGDQYCGAIAIPQLQEIEIASSTVRQILALATAGNHVVAAREMRAIPSRRAD